MPVEFKGFTIWLVSGLDPIEEYGIQVEDDKTVSCYVPSEAGKEFKICWEDRGRLSQSVVACYMDGRAVGGKPSERGIMGVNEGVFISPTKMRPFVFGNVVTTDDDDIASPDGADPDLGCIQIEILRVRDIRKEKTRTQTTQVHDVGPVHERSKKLGAHCVALGAEEQAKQGEFLTPKFQPGTPYAVFRFMYRPREILMARGIMPLPRAGAEETKPAVAEISEGPSRQTRHSTRSRTRSSATATAPQKPKRLTAQERKKAKTGAKGKTGVKQESF